MSILQATFLSLGRSGGRRQGVLVAPTSVSVLHEGSGAALRSTNGLPPPVFLRHFRGAVLGSSRILCSVWLWVHQSQQTQTSEAEVQRPGFLLVPACSPRPCPVWAIQPRPAEDARAGTHFSLWYMESIFSDSITAVF